MTDWGKLLHHPQMIMLAFPLFRYRVKIRRGNSRHRKLLTDENWQVVGWEWDYENAEFTNAIHLNGSICIEKLHCSVILTTNIFQLHKEPSNIFKVTCPQAICLFTSAIQKLARNIFTSWMHGQAFSTRC